MLVDKFNFLQGAALNAIHPKNFRPELTDDRLSVVATSLLDVRYATIREMNTQFDDNYTRETAVFGRSRNMLIQLAQNGKYDWLSLKHAGMDITFVIGEVPCRFFRDDPESPDKLGFFKRNAVDDLFSTDDQEPVMWRFVLEKAMTEDDEDKVFFLGYNVYQEKVAEWEYSASTAALHSVDKDTPSAIEIPPASVEVRDDQSDKQDEDRKTGNNE
jgi:hypothetical protein